MSSDGLCSALFDTEQGTGICEVFGQHARHAGVVTRGVFRCHLCRNVITDGGCRCPRASAEQRLGLDRP